jgi:predicted secreted Zn-dependent protease
VCGGEAGVTSQVEDREQLCCSCENKKCTVILSTDYIMPLGKNMQNSHLEIQTFWDVMMFHRANRVHFLNN